MVKYSQKDIRKFLEQSDTARTSDQKGSVLEDLVEYLFAGMAGVELYRRNKFNSSRSREWDLVFTINRNYSELHFLDSFLAVECKNTKKPTPSHEVGWFATKLRGATAKNGLLVSLSGITGSNDRMHGRSEIQAAKYDGIRVLVLCREEILSLRNSRELSEMLHSKFLMLCIDDVIMI